jgi:beta-phosphoglucomutase
MTNIRGFIFDLDGVLVDTAEYHYRGWQRLADEEGLPFDRKANEALRGISRRESLMLILGGRIIPEEKIQEMMERKNHYYVEFIQQITLADMLPGALDLLKEIRVAGLKCAIGSASKNTCTVVERLGIEHLVDAILDGYSVNSPKPAPDLFLHAARQLGLPPVDCVVVEDAAAGVEAAIAGGFRSIGLGPVDRVGAANVVYPSLEGLHLSKILSDLG